MTVAAITKATEQQQQHNGCNSRRCSSSNSAQLTTNIMSTSTNCGNNNKLVLLLLQLLLPPLPLPLLLLLPFIAHYNRQWLLSHSHYATVNTIIFYFIFICVCIEQHLKVITSERLALAAELKLQHLNSKKYLDCRCHQINEN
ncbi:unnamed protein product [Ceratitis capitata]|uniref:(Mediterranean fruit fly) hypothetical protein n=1 Tax=Ceratitis capitata TaxID=7213 RepID=A0A811UZE6_CERCA|nr:unnamed protein product [Ceratitis capitata]